MLLLVLVNYALILYAWLNMVTWLLKLIILISFAISIDDVILTVNQGLVFQRITSDHFMDG